MNSQSPHGRRDMRSPSMEGSRCTKCEKASSTALQLKLENMKLERELDRQKSEVEFYKNKDKENQVALAALR